jgi:hypothetical protein
MAAHRASPSSRELRRRRSLAQVTALLQQLHQPSPPLSTEECLALREQIRQAADPVQPSLPLFPTPPKGSPS